MPETYLEGGGALVRFWASECYLLIGDNSGIAVSEAGDVNGDGFDDLLIGAYDADSFNNIYSDAGDSYVIFGGVSLPASLDLATLGSSGVTVYGADALDQSGGAVSGAGDVNGDGFDDILIGAEGGDGPDNMRNLAGEGYLVFGSATLPLSLNLASLGAGGITIYGVDAAYFTGNAVGAAGNTNSDNFDDIVIGAYCACGPNFSRPFAGQSYLIFGSDGLPPEIELYTLDTGGITAYGAEALDLSGGAVSGAGDINGDNRDDFLIGADSADGPMNARPFAGESYIILGSGPLAVELERFEAQATGDAIVVLWETASEEDTLGFHLYRATTLCDTPIRINTHLIQAKATGSSNGALYEWIDTNVATGETYYYWLDEIDMYGNSTRYGPVYTTMPVPTLVKISDVTVASTASLPGVWLVSFGFLLFILRRWRR